MPFALDNPNRSLISRVMQATSPVGLALAAVSSIARGVTDTNDHSQATTSVQSSGPSATGTGGGNIGNSGNMGGITTLTSPTITDQGVADMYNRYLQLIQNQNPYPNNQFYNRGS
jgi:hypothetical protein